MPVVESLMRDLKRRYGQAKGERVYYAMEASASGPFGEGKKHHDKHKAWASAHGVRPLRGKKKPPRRRARGRKRRR